MSQKVHSSKHLNWLFLKRFRGKISSINKEGELTTPNKNDLPIIKQPKRLLELGSFRRGSLSVNQTILSKRTKAKEVEKNGLNEGLSISYDNKCNMTKMPQESKSWKEHKRVPSDLREIGKEIIMSSWRNNIKYKSVPKGNGLNESEGDNIVEVLARTNFQKLYLASSTINYSKNEYTPRKVQLSILLNKKTNK